MSKTKPLINEIFFIRFIACMSVVLIHAITFSTQRYSFHADTLSSLRNIQMIFMFATPIFVFISEFILGYSYARRKPNQFWLKRVQFILLPYLVAGFLCVLIPFALAGELSSILPFLKRLLLVYFLGEWHGYFVIIIFQFYFLHYFFKKYLDRFSPKMVILISFLVNYLFLYYVNFSDRIDHPYASLFYKYSKLLFIGWIFYFVVAYYCGTHIHTFIRGLKKYRYWIITGFLASLFLIFYLVENQILGFTSSKRVDMLPYTVLVFFLLYYLAQKIKQIPQWVLYISQASYAIYLLHPLFQWHLVDRWLLGNVQIHFTLYIGLLFLIGIIGPLFVTLALNRWKYGPYLVGKVRFLPQKTKETAHKA